MWQLATTRSHSESLHSRLQMLPKALETLELSPIPFLGPASEFGWNSSTKRSAFDFGRAFPSLRTIKLGNEEDEALDELLKSLPVSLTRFSLRYDSLQPHDMPLLPQSLLYLDANIIIGSLGPEPLKSSFSSFLGAPPSIEVYSRVQSHIYSYPRVEMPMDECWTQWLPPTLETLTFNAWCTPNMIAMTPRHLVAIHLEDNPYLDWSMFMEQVEAKGVENGPSKVSTSIWPCTLKTLGIFLNTLRRGAIKAVPCYIETLIIELSPALFSSDKLELFADELPPRLRSLAFRSAPSNWARIEIKEAAIPPLTSLSFGKGLNINSEDIGNLPKSLTQLTLNASFTLHPSQTISSLPQEHLTSLSIAQFHPTLFAKLPRSLFSLQITTLFLKRVEGVTTDFDLLFSELPPLLTSFELENFKIEETLSLVSLAHLARLETLALPNHLNIQASTLSHLPRSLKRLSITVAEMSGSDLARLPPGLCKLSLSCDPASFTLEDLGNHWPLHAIQDLEDKFRTQCIPVFLARIRALD